MGAIPKANWSAKERTRSSLHYGGEGVFIHLSNQGVCGWHGAEDLYVTPGGLNVFLSGIKISDSISESEVRSKAC
jgi:hypothetical protein